MELREFVHASLVDIVTAVQDADGEIKNVGGMLNPGRRSMTSGQSVSREVGLLPIQEVEFDVAVTASKSRGTEAKAGIEVVGISLGLGGKASAQSEAVSVSRLKFSVPLVFPSSVKG